MADSFQLKAILSAVDKISPTLKTVRAGINATHKTFRDLGSASRGLLGSIGLPAAISFGAVGYAALHAAQGALEYAGALQDASDKTGVAIGPLQSLQTVFEASGVSSEDFIESVTKLNKGLAEAGAGKDASLLGLLTKLRIPLRDAHGQIRSVESVLPQLADAFAKNENPAVRTRIAMELFGKAGAKMIATLKGGGKALIDAQEDAKRLGAVLSDEATGKLDDLGDSLGLISRQVKVQLAAAFAVAAPAVMSAVKAISEWIGANKELLQQKIGGYIERIAKAFQGWVESGGFERLGSGIIYVLDSVQGLIEAAGGLGNVLKGIGALILIGPAASAVQLAAVFLRIGTYIFPLIVGGVALIGQAFTALSAVVLANPIGAVAAAIGVAVFAIYKYWDPLVSYFSGLWDRIKPYIQPILSAAGSVASTFGRFFGGSAPNAPLSSGSSPLNGALTAQSSTKLNGEVVVRFQDAPAGLRVDPGKTNQPGLSINPDVGYRSQLAF
ncbi:phage tail tape measure protein [Caballeronia cordobensis]|uniref:phage tail tape measure protein n=1 Tax=Caballeronia cordobensis TaxID=1353886 RepID=UPI00045EE556|nr:putative membrane protein [Burkholderia sp. RPE67]